MKKLIFVTSKYPYGNGETFIENEIGYLSAAFDEVYIYATEAHDTEEKRPVPENVSVFVANPKPVSKNDYLTSLFNVSVIKEIFKNCLKGNFIRKISACCYFYSCFTKSTKNIPEFLKICDIKDDDDITVYSYWLSTIGMCAVKIYDNIQKIGIKSKIVSRCHRFDLYSDRFYCGYQPFQKHMISKINKVFPCSKDGEKYLKELYPQYSEKIIVSYLGVKDHFSSAFPTKSEIFNIVSCSNVIPVKRVNLIIESLAGITDKSISWTHFGDGEDFEKIKKLAKEKLPENIKYEFKGRVPNTEIYDYYNNNNVNLFINVSESEGLPVSIMEAISFGIPVIATDVGGTGEIVFDGKNGVLIKSAFDIDELARLIVSFCQMPNEEYRMLCKAARNSFEKSFNAKTNYTVFCDLIKPTACS